MDSKLEIERINAIEDPLERELAASLAALKAHEEGVIVHTIVSAAFKEAIAKHKDLNNKSI